MFVIYPNGKQIASVFVFSFAAVEQVITSRNTNNSLLELEVQMTCTGVLSMDLKTELLSFWFVDNRDRWHSLKIISMKFYVFDKIFYYSMLLFMQFII